MQTGYSSAQGQCTGQGGEGGEAEREERWTLYSPTQRGQTGPDPLRCVCMSVYVHESAHSVFVHMFASCIDVSVLHSFPAEVNEQVQVSSTLTCSYR